MSPEEASANSPRPYDARPFRDFTRDSTFTGFDRITFANIPDYVGYLPTLILSIPLLKDGPDALVETSNRLNVSLFDTVANMVRSTAFLDKSELESLLDARHCINGVWSPSIRWRKASQVPNRAVGGSASVAGRGSSSAARGSTTSAAPCSFVPTRSGVRDILSSALLQLLAPAEQDPLAAIRVTMPGNMAALFHLLEHLLTQSRGGPSERAEHQSLLQSWTLEFVEDLFRLASAVPHGRCSSSGEHSSMMLRTRALPPRSQPSPVSDRFASDEEADLDISCWGAELRALAILYGPQLLQKRKTLWPLYRELRSTGGPVLLRPESRSRRKHWRSSAPLVSKRGSSAHEKIPNVINCAPN